MYAGNTFQNGNNAIQQSPVQSGYSQQEAQMAQDLRNSQQMVSQSQYQVFHLQNENMQLKNTLNHLQAQKQAQQQNERPRQFCSNWDHMVYSNEPNGKTKPIGYFAIQSVQEISVAPDNQIFLLVQYVTKGNDIYTSEPIPSQAVQDRKLLRFFHQFQPADNLSRSIINDFLFEAIKKTHSSGCTLIPAHAGFYFSSKNALSFFSASANLPQELQSILPDAVRNKCFYMEAPSSPDEIIAQCATENLTVLLLHSLRLAGMISSILYGIEMPFQQIIILTGSSHKLSEIASCYLQTYNRPKLQTYALDTAVSKLQKILDTANDETVIFSDMALFDNQKRQNAGLQYLYHDLLHVNTEIPDSVSYHNIAIVSNAASSLLPQERIFCVPIDGIPYTSTSSGALSVRFQQIDNLWIDMICHQGNQFYKSLQKKMLQYGFVVPSVLSSESKRTYCILMSIMSILSDIKIAKVSESEFSDYLLQLLQNTVDNHTEQSDLIVNHFGKALNHAIRTGVISVVKWGKTMEFEPGQHIAIQKDDLLILEESTIKEILLPSIHITNRFSVLTDALKKTNILRCTKGQRYTTTVYQKGGISHRDDFFAVHMMDLLDADVLDFLNSTEDTVYFGAYTEDLYLIPFVKNAAGNTACRMIYPNRMENRHTFVTGKSGSGKSTFLTQYMCSLYKLDETVLVFDKNDSFTRADLERLLSKDFVEEHVQFFDIETEGFPVDPLPEFESENCDNITEILLAPFQDLKQTQKIAAATMLQEYLMQSDYIGFEEMFSLESNDPNCTWIHGSSGNSIRFRLEPLCNALYEHHVSMNTWDDLLNGDPKIIVISMPNLDEVGNQLIDLYLQSFLKWKMDNQKEKVHLLLDEVQSQNLSEKSPILKILKEGRKYGISLIYATQEFTKDNKGICRAARQAGTKVYLHPDEDSISLAAKSLGFTTKDMGRLHSLKKFECIVHGEFYDFTKKENVETIVQGMLYRHFDETV